MSLLRRLSPILIFAVGMGMAHRPMLASGLARVQTDTGDPRLLNYILEHGYRWASGDPKHGDFWSPPFFFPARNAAGYSDVLLGTAPVYWAWRTVGAWPDTAFQLWLMTLSGLNFLGGYLMIRKGFGLSSSASAMGAFLLAFGAPRINQLGHAQLLAQFPTFATIDALARLFGGTKSSKKRRCIYWAVAVLGVVVQFYAGFYLGWFLALALGVAACWAIALPTCRRRVLPILAVDAPAVLAAGMVGAALLGPMAWHYLDAAREIGPRSYPMVLRMVPRPSSWLYLGPRSHLYGWMARLPPYRGRPLELEHRMGIGPLTTLACLAGLLLRPTGRFLALVGLVLLAMTVLLPGRTIAFVAPWLAASCATLLWRERDCPWRKPVAGAVAASILLTIRDRPTLWTIALGLVPAVILAAKGDRPNRSQARTLVVISTVSLLALWGFRGTDTLWKHIYDHIPAGAAVRAVARVGLVLLIPAAVGLASALDALAERRRFAIASLVGLACILEQWVETPSYAKLPKRIDVAAVAASVDRRCDAFFFSHPHSPFDSHEDQLDAMWASLATGVPTVNGYSGGSPRDWDALKEVHLRDDTDRDLIGAALLRWSEAHGVHPRRICWIGGPPDGPFAPGLGDDPGRRARRRPEGPGPESPDADGQGDRSDPKK